MPVIRAYRPGDETGIAHVIKTVYEEYGFPWQPEGHNKDAYDVEAHYNARGGAFWVLQNDDEAIIGTVGLTKKQAKRCELHRLYLLKDYRGKGYGKQLFLTAINAAREMGCTEMEIWSDKRLDRSHNLYLAFGATLLGDRLVADPNYPEEYEEWGYLLSLDRVTNSAPRPSSTYTHNL